MELLEQIVQTAHARRRWGYRMIHDVLRPQYPGINHKRVYRMYTTEGLSIRKRKKTQAHWRARAAGGCNGGEPDLEHGLCERCNRPPWRGVTADQMPHGCR